MIAAFRRHGPALFTAVNDLDAVSAGRAACLDLVVDNLAEIAVVYGDAAAARLLVEISYRAEVALQHMRCSVHIEPFGLRIDAAADQFGAADVERLLFAGAASAYRIGDLKLVASLSCTWPADEASTYIRTAYSSYNRADSYQRDMEHAARAYDALLEGRLQLLMQPIVATMDHDKALYSECLSRIVGDDQPCPPGVFIPALERLGLTRYFDRAVVQATLDLLRDLPDGCLGCNISSLSATDDEWWTTILADLAQNPHLARRLVLELTESAMPVDPVATIEFVRRLRALGCRVALDDFGAGFTSIAFAHSSCVDIVKIDGRFVKYHASEPGGRNLLEHLVCLAGDLASSVIVEGVENKLDLTAARQAGAEWVQGYFIGMPRPVHEDAPPRDVGDLAAPRPNSVSQTRK